MVNSIIVNSIISAYKDLIFYLSRFIKYLVNVLFLERRRMASKKVKELKPKDQIYSAFLDGHKAYAAWAEIESINKLRVYDSKVSKFRMIHELTIRPVSGILKGEAFDIKLDEEGTVKVPPKPNKAQRIWRAIFS